MLLGLVDSGSPDLSGLATKQELEDAITQVETDLAPVDEVTSGNMQSVTSNAVYNTLVSEKHDTFEGLSLWKVGKFVYGLFSKTIVSGTSNPAVIYILPQEYRPKIDVRVACINNTFDAYAGQFIIYQDGYVRFWSASGTFTGDVYNCSFCYMVA
jgi:hypothetical protein